MKKILSKLFSKKKNNFTINMSIPQQKTIHEMTKKEFKNEIIDDINDFIDMIHENESNERAYCYEIKEKLIEYSINFGPFATNDIKDEDLFNNRLNDIM